MAGVMAAEQYTLDDNLQTAWKLTGLDTPPWEAWNQLDVQVLKKGRAKSKIVEAAWIAAIVAGLKDEDFLMKKRGGGKGGGKEGDAKKEE